MTKENSPCNFEECGFNYTLALINGKYKMSILYCLFRYELKRFLSSISFKTLTNTLRELENDGLIIRKEYAQIPPKVEYSLSKRGQSLIPILQAMSKWGKKDKKGKKCLN